MDFGKGHLWVIFNIKKKEGNHLKSRNGHHFLEAGHNSVNWTKGGDLIGGAERFTPPSLEGLKYLCLILYILTA